MRNYYTIQPNNGTPFPGTKFIDCSALNVLDGTPVLSSPVNEWLAFSQAALNEVGQVPNGVTDTFDSCQILDALRFSCGAPGELVFWMGRDISAEGLAGRRLVQAAGQYILVEDYPQLVSAVWVGEDDNDDPGEECFFKVSLVGGVWTRDSEGTHLKLPDLRGRFPAATGPVDDWQTYLLRASLNPGEGFSQAFQSHEHEIYYRSAAGVLYSTPSQRVGDRERAQLTPSGAGYSYYAFTSGTYDADIPWPTGIRCDTPKTTGDRYSSVTAYHSPYETRPWGFVAHAMLRY